MKKAANKYDPLMRGPLQVPAVARAARREDMDAPTEAARRDLLASLERGSRDLESGLVERKSIEELKADMRADFERITGYTIS